MTDAEIVNAAIAGLSLGVASVALIVTSRATKRSLRLTREAAISTSEEETVKRALKHNVLRGLISIYQTLDDFNSYLWEVQRMKNPISVEFVADFYLKKTQELADLRGTPVFYEFLRALQTFRPRMVVAPEEVARRLEAGKVPTDGIDSLRNDLTNGDVGTVLGALEANSWWCLLDVAQKLKNQWSIPDDEQPSKAKDELLKDLVTEEQKAIFLILRRTLHTMNRIEVLLMLLKAYEPQLSLHFQKLHDAEGLT